MLSFWICFLSFFYTVNIFSTEEEKVKKKCGICLEEFEENDSSTLIKSKKIFSCNCNENNLICKKCILRLIEGKINSKKEEKLAKDNEKILILELIFGHIREAIKKKNNNLQDFVKKIIEEKEEIEEEEKNNKNGNKNIKIGEYKQLNEEKKLVYRAINKEEDKDGIISYYIGDEKDPKEKLKFIKSFLSLLRQFNEIFHNSFKSDIELSLLENSKIITIEEIEKWEEKDIKIEVSGSLDTTELQKKIKNEEVIRIECPFCKREIKKESTFFLKKIFEEPCCIKYCEYLCPFCC